MRRQAAALVTLEQPLEEGAVEVMIAKAKLLSTYENVRDNEAELIQALKRAYAFQLLELSEDESLVEQGYKLTALESMLSDKGIDFVAVRQKIAAGVNVEETPDPAQREDQGVGGKNGTPPWIGKTRFYPLSPADGTESPVVQDLSRRLQQAELKIASQELKAAEVQQESSQKDFASAIIKFCEEANAASPAKEVRNSTIKVEPRIN